MKALKTNKFKVGDKVQVIESNNTEEWFNVKIGKVIGVVDHIEEIDLVGCVYFIRIKGYAGIYNKGCFAFSGEHLELVAEQQNIKVYNPLVAQEGGGHYKNRGIQPLEYTMKNNLSFCEGNVVKYISRYKSKNGVEDLAKVIHYALLASYEEYGEQGSTELKEKVLKLLGEHG